MRRPLHHWPLFLGLVLASLSGLVAPAAAQTVGATLADAATPVDTVAEERLAVPTAEIPVALSQDWDRPRHAVARAVVVIHGVRRNAEAYLRIATRAREEAGALPSTTLLIAPQFLTVADADARGVAPSVLRWRGSSWMSGASAVSPSGVSSFAVLDALLARLADPQGFPALRHVVIAGHSAGAQLVQRYAAVGRGDAALASRGITIRYVVANPSSYLWFGDERPRPAPAGTCPQALRWKYGLANAPPYVQGDPAEIEARYLARDVVYLLGEADTDPDHRFLDRSCAAMTQGETRFARGMQFMYWLELRHPAQVHHLVVALPGIGHDAAKVFASPCGLAALFERPGCRGLR